MPRYFLLLTVSVFFVNLGCGGSQKAPEGNSPQEASSGDESCTFNFSDFKSPLDSGSKKFKWIQEEQRSESGRTVTQKGQLMTGELIDYSGGGCAHFAYSFTFTNAKGLERGKPNLQIAKKLLQDLPMKKEDALLLDALDRAARGETPHKNDEGVYELSCGDAACLVDTRRAGKIQISYNFAL